MMKRKGIELLNNPFWSSVLFYYFLFFSSAENALGDLLCRNCGHMITTAEAITNVHSPMAEHQYNVTVLGVESLIQQFRNPADEVFQVLTVKGADLKFQGDSYSADTWFPSMRWRACVCSACGKHMGWYFQSPKQDFVGLVLDYLIGSEYADTLTVVPKLS